MFDEEKAAERLDLFCPSCNILVQAMVQASATGTLTEEQAGIYGPEDSLYCRVQYKIAICGRCDGPFFIQVTSQELPGEFMTETGTQVLYPSERSTSLKGVPPTPLRAYEQAARSYRAGLYEPCAIMCRKCLEAVCAEHKSPGRNLKERLEHLRQAGTIDSKLFQWADELRIVGNDAAHDLDIVIGHEDARDALEFVEAILLYVFSLNTRFEAFQRRRRGSVGEATGTGAPDHAGSSPSGKSGEKI